MADYGAAEAAAPPPAPVTASAGGEAIASDEAAGEAVADVAGEEPTAELEQATSAMLTAASVGDVDRRDNYLSYLGRHPTEASEIDLDMRRRVRIRVLDQQQRPVNDARVEVVGAATQASGRTHADGYWDYYPSVYGAGAGRAQVRITSNQQVVTGQLDIADHGDGPDRTFVVRRATAAPQALDLAFAIDVTGSMEDELRYVNSEIGSIVQRIQRELPETSVRVGATFYRDRSDRQVIQELPFTTDVTGFARAMQSVRASGGGDYPEDLNAGLEAALSRLQWSEGNAVRVLVVIADAPPKRYHDAQFTYRHAMLDAAARGIRILPVAASGSDRTVEYLFRAMGAYTSTPYVYSTLR